MTRVDFYFNAAGKTDVAMRLTAKAYQAGQRTLLYTGEEALAAQLDAGLWTAQQISFIPHVRCGHPLAVRTPILIGVRPDELVSCDVLINLTPGPPGCFDRFDRLIEIVTADETDRLQARSRFRFYQERGHALETHDLKRK